MSEIVCTHFVMVHDSTVHPQPATATYGTPCVMHYMQYWFTNEADAQAFAEKFRDSWRHVSVKVGQPKTPYVFHEGHIQY